MLQRIARSVMYRAFGLLCYDPRSEKAVPGDALTAPPTMLIIDPTRVGLFDSSIERVVPRNDPAIPPFTLDQLTGNARRATVAMPSDRYDLVLALLGPGTGICLDACTPIPRPQVQREVEAKGYSYVAIDIQRAKDIRQEDLTRLTFADGSIARIISCDTIEHIEDYAAAAREMYRVLAPEGLAILHFPVYYYERPRGTPIPPTADPYGHVRFFSAREMIELFDQIGFAVLHAQFNFDYGALMVALSKRAA